MKTYDPVYTDGRVSLYQGDSCFILPRLQKESVDCVITDPPYPEIDRPYGRMTESEWQEMMHAVVYQIRRLLKPTGSAVFILQANSEKVGRMRSWLWDFQSWLSREWGIIQDVYWWNFTTTPTVHAHRDVGLLRPSVKACVWAGYPDCYRNQDAVLWEESQANTATRLAQRARTTDPYYTPSGYITNKKRATQASEDRGGVTPFNLLPISNTNSRTSGGARGHGASTPMALCDWWVRYLAPPDALILDPFSGTSTVGEAAVRLRHRFIGIEKHPEYVELSKERLQNLQ